MTAPRAQIWPTVHCSLGKMLKALRDPSGMGQKWLPIGGLLLLSLLWAVGWVRADLSPGATAASGLGPLLSEAVLLGVFAVLAAIGGAIVKKPWPGGAECGRAVLAGVGLFVVPALLNLFTKERIEDTSRVALFSLTPLFAVLFEPHLEADDGKNALRGGMQAALAAVAGTFLVFPVELPRSYASAFAMLGVVMAAGAVAAANCVGVNTVQRRKFWPLTFASVSAGSASLLLGIAGLIHHDHVRSGAAFDAWAMLDLLALALLFWLMQRMSAAKMTTRFLIAPLLANLMSLALLRPHVGIQSWIGLALIATASGWMLFAPEDAAASVTSLRIH